MEPRQARRVLVVGTAANEASVSLVSAWKAHGLDARLCPADVALADARGGDVVLGRLDVRPTLDGVERGLFALWLLEQRGVRVLNRPAALLASHDKLRTARLLERARVPHPRTAWLAPGAGRLPLEPPVVVKPRFGSWGKDVFLCETAADAERCLGTLQGRRWFRRHGAIVQEAIPPARWDIRAVIAHGRIVGAAMRVAAPGEWRTNVSLGGSTYAIELDEETAELARTAAAVSGGDLVGVDLVPRHDGTYTVLELNGAVEFDPSFVRNGEDIYLAVGRALRLLPGRPSAARGAKGAAMRRIVIMGAGGRDFHNFNVALRHDPDVEVVAFTAAQIPGIAGRTYPSALAGPRYPEGIPIRAEDELAQIVREQHVDEVVLAYSDLRHETVMHKASIVLATGADFRLMGPHATMLRSTKPVVAVCATRTGCGKSQTSRKVAQTLIDAGLTVALVRHPMPYGDLDSMRVQRFTSLEEIDASHPTIEEREEYEEPVRLGVAVYAGVDYEAILRRAEAEADVVLWDGGNNDFPFFAPDLLIVVADALRPGHELRYHPGETNLRLANVVVVNKVDTADPRNVEEIVANVESANPMATLVFAKSPPRFADEQTDLTGRSVLVVDDGPTLTHGEMPFGAGLVAARAAGAAKIVDPRPYAVGSLHDLFEQWTQLENVLPAMGYSDEQLHELEQTINAAECDVVVTGTPIDLSRLIASRHPIEHVRYELEEIGTPTIADVLAPILARGRREVIA